MSERTLILSMPENFVMPPQKPSTLASRLFKNLTEKYDAIIDILFKWTN